MLNKSLILVVNPGSASRKYSLYSDGAKLADINFEFENGKVISVLKYNDQKYPNTHSDADLSAVSRYILPLLHHYQVIAESDKLTAIGIRVVAPSNRFTRDQLVDDDSLAALAAVQQRAPLHVGTALAEIQQLKTYFTDTPIVIISDSAFHATKPEWASHYGIDIELSERIEVKRYGYHGISVGSVVNVLQSQNMLPAKAIICHLGSGSSISAVVDGKSVETTMGYTPLEGLMMLTRAGNMDISAALAIKRELQLTDEGLEEYLNKKCGLSGISGTSGDVRDLLAADAAGDAKAQAALKMFVYRIQMAIGQMAAAMNGVDAIIFTATIGERSAPIRARILDNLGYLGLSYGKQQNDAVFEPKQPINIAATGSKPIIIISTDESSEIARRAAEFIK